MRAFKISFACVLVVTTALLALGVFDFCRVADDGAVVWEPTLRTSAVRRYGAALWRAADEAITPETVRPSPEVARKGRPARAPAPSPVR